MCGRAHEACCAWLAGKPSGFPTLVFLGHGMQDGKVRTWWGEELRDLIQEPGLDVTWMGYQDLGYWYGVPLGTNGISGSWKAMALGL